MRVARGRIELGVTEQDLDYADIGVALEQMRREGVAQGMRRDPRAIDIEFICVHGCP